MPTTVPIPGGEATFRDKLKVRQRNLVEDAQAALMVLVTKLPPELLSAVEKANAQPGGSEEPLVVAENVPTITLSVEDAKQMKRLEREVDEARLVAYLESWTLPRPLPTLDTLGDEDEDVYDALMGAVADLELAKRAEPLDMAETPIGTARDPVDSPTPGSESSATPSPEGSDPVGALTPASSPAGAPTSTAAPSPV